MGLEYDDDDDDDGLSASLDAAFVPTPITQLPVHFNDAKYPPVPKLLPKGLHDFHNCPAPPSCHISPLPLRETMAPR